MPAILGVRKNTVRRRPQGVSESIYTALRRVLIYVWCNFVTKCLFWLKAKAYWRALYCNEVGIINCFDSKQNSTDAVDIVCPILFWFRAIVTWRYRNFGRVLKRKKLYLVAHIPCLVKRRKTLQTFRSGFLGNAKVFVRKESFLKIDPLLWSSSDSGAQSKSVATVDIRDSLLFSWHSSNKFVPQNVLWLSEAYPPPDPDR